MNGVARFIAALFDWAWSSSLHASVLILLVFLVQFAFGKVLPVRWRYMLGLLVLLRLILPAAPESEWSVFNLSNYQAVPPSAVPAVTREEAIHASGSGLTQSAAYVPEEPGPPMDWMTVAQVTWLLGLAGSLLVVGWRHRRFANWVKGLPALQDGRVNSLLGQCKRIMNVRRELLVVSMPGPGTPALFGFRKPRLLLPEGTLRKLDDIELRMVFLHELAHVRRGDIALNWAMILVRSLHWFNPLVWLAMKRLRADRELVCDAMVMARLSPGEHRVYGGTLIKLLDDFSGAESCPSRVPVINNKSEIKRRVTMIAKFKSPGRAAVLASAAVVVVLCAFTFTRAAEKKVKSGKGDAAAFDPYFVQTVAARTNQVEHWKQKLAELEGRIAVAQDEVDAWGPVSSRIAEDRSESGLHPDIIRRLESERISTDANYRGLAELLHQLRALKEKGGNELKKSILSAHPDAQLAKLLDDLWTTEAKMAQLKTTHGPEHVELKAIAETQAILSAKVNERIEGILSGLEVRAAAAKAQRDSLMQSIQEVKIKDTQGTTQYRSYLQARRNLENLQKVRDALYLKILELEYGVAAPKSDVK